MIQICLYDLNIRFEGQKINGYLTKNLSKQKTRDKGATRRYLHQLTRVGFKSFLKSTQAYQGLMALPVRFWTSYGRELEEFRQSTAAAP